MLEQNEDANASKTSLRPMTPDFDNAGVEGEDQSQATAEKQQE